MDKNRLTAYYTLMDIEKDLAYSNLALKHHIRRGKPDSPAFVRELTYGVLRNRIYLDHIIKNFVKTPIEKTRPGDLTLLRMGLHQLIFMNSVPEYAAVNETVNLAKKFTPGQEGFINGVLRQFLRDREYVALPDRNKSEVDYLSIKYSYAPWIVEMWLKAYESETVEKLMEAGNKTPQFTIRVNRLKTTRDDAVERLNSRGFRTELCERSPMGLQVNGTNLLYNRMYLNGLFSVQDESSQLAAEISGAAPGETIIDVCAAPGGKTLAMAEMMGNRGKILSWDIYKRKLSLLEHEAKRLGITIAETRTWDASRVDSELINKADRVFVDAPCTGLGVVRRKPEIKYKDNVEDLADLYKKQLGILSASSNYVKPGGVLIYTTCTISPLENQNIVKEFLKKNKGFERRDTIQLLPHEDKMDGFFICKMQRT
ncbi:ribosomal RNA small subunit methyltransferase B [Clostridia bacterium]|nr:ribosomal RNA small subunit methyltransferase B [Clostridia bacterium]